METLGYVEKIPYYRGKTIEELRDIKTKCVAETKLYFTEFYDKCMLVTESYYWCMDELEQGKSKRLGDEKKEDTGTLN